MRCPKYPKPRQRQTSLTPDQLNAIRNRAYNDTAKEMAAHGLELTYAEIESIGYQSFEWLCCRLNLFAELSTEGATLRPHKRFL